MQGLILMLVVFLIYFVDDLLGYLVGSFFCFIVCIIGEEFILYILFGWWIDYLYVYLYFRYFILLYFRGS